MAKFFGNYILVKKESEIESTFSIYDYLFFFMIYILIFIFKL